MATSLPVPQSGNDIIESVIAKGDLAKLSPEERTRYYVDVCKSIGLNPFTKPFEYITLNGKLTLYARRDAADQLRKINGISIAVVSRDTEDDLLIVHVRARDAAGRSDEDFGAVSIAGLRGEAKANAILKAITKAKRRVTLSISGLGFLDESEVEDISIAAKSAAATDLDAFAAAPAPRQPIDDKFLAVAESKAADGAATFRDWWKTLSKGNREQLRDHLPRLQESAEKADAAVADADGGAAEDDSAELEPAFLDEAHAVEALR